jgi:hypothetical protein
MLALSMQDITCMAGEAQLIAPSVFFARSAKVKVSEFRAVLL